MKKQYPIDIVMAIWRQLNTSPWITLKRNHRRFGPTLYFEMLHSKTNFMQPVKFEPRNIYTLADTWTQEYIVERLTTALAALIHNTAEAGVSSFDVYREDYPA